MNASQDWSNLGLQRGDLVTVNKPGDGPRIGMVTDIGYPAAGSLQILRIQVMVGGELLTIDKYHLSPLDTELSPEDEEAFNEMNGLLTDMGVWKLGDEGR